MRVLLVNPPIRTTAPPSDYPYGLALIASVLEQNSIEFDVLDVNGYRYNNKEVLEFLSANIYGIIGIGGLITTYSYIKWFTNQVRQILPRAKVVVGGGVATWNPEFVLRHIKPDLVVSGEGEETFLDIVKNFDFEHMNYGEPFLGTTYLDNNGRYVFKPRNLIKDLDELPLPAWHRFPMEVYISNNKYNHYPQLKLQRGIEVYSARGCPMNCSFCYHIFGRGVRARRLEKVIAEIKILQELYAPDHIDILDEFFTFDKQRVLNFCCLYKESGIKLPFRTGGRLDMVDAETVATLVQAGCVFFGVGVESGSPKILEKMQKRITPNKMAESIAIFRNYGLDVVPTFIHGMVGEDEITVRESIAFYKKMNFKNVRPFFIQPYPGSPMWTKDIEEKVLKEYKSLENYIKALGEAEKFVINLSNLSDRKLLVLHRKITFETSGMSIFSYYFNEVVKRFKQVRDKGLFWVINRLIDKLSHKLRCFLPQQP